MSEQPSRHPIRSSTQAVLDHDLGHIAEAARSIIRRVERHSVAYWASASIASYASLLQQCVRAGMIRDRQVYEFMITVRAVGDELRKFDPEVTS